MVVGVGVPGVLTVGVGAGVVGPVVGAGVALADVVGSKLTGSALAGVARVVAPMARARVAAADTAVTDSRVIAFIEAPLLCARDAARFGSDRAPLAQHLAAERLNHTLRINAICLDFSQEELPMGGVRLRGPHTPGTRKRRPTGSDGVARDQVRARRPWPRWPIYGSRPGCCE